MLEGKKILVAGADGFLGSQLLKHLLHSGAEVVATGLDKKNTEDKFAAMGVVPEKEKLQLHSLDVTDEVAVIGFFEGLQQCDGAVNCSYPRNKTYGTDFLQVTMASFNDNLALHLGSSFTFAQQCARYFLKHKHTFSLVNIASIYGAVAPDFNIYKDTHMTMPVEYAVIKSGLIHLNKYIANYVSDSQFRVNSVSPGGLLDGQPESFLNAYRNKTHGTGMLLPEDICGTIAFLLSESSHFITGQNILVDDGFSL